MGALPATPANSESDVVTMVARVGIQRVGLWVAATALSAAALTGCGADATKVTCAEFAAQTYDDQNKTLDGLLRAHDLEVLDMGNQGGIHKAVLNFCGQGASAITGGKATRNRDEPLDKAVDWDAEQW